MANEKEILEKIWKEIKRLADIAEQSTRGYNEEEETSMSVLTSGNFDIWDEAKMWLNSVFQEAIIQTIREHVQEMKNGRDNIYRVVHELATIIRVKREIMQYLSEDGILKLDEELRKMNKEEEKHRNNAVKEVKEKMIKENKK